MCLQPGANGLVYRYSYFRAEKSPHAANSQQTWRLSVNPQKLPPIVFQFADGIANIVQRQMGRRLLDTCENVRRPAPGQFLQGADIEIPVMEELLERWHLAGQEPSILANAVAAHR